MNVGHKTQPINRAGRMLAACRCNTRGCCTPLSPISVTSQTGLSDSRQVSCSRQSFASFDKGEGYNRGPVSCLQKASRTSTLAPLQSSKPSLQTPSRDHLAISGLCSFRRFLKCCWAAWALDSKLLRSHRSCSFQDPCPRLFKQRAACGTDTCQAGR